MRDSNYKSISGNKAAVTITTSLYDRRALDVTSDKPLVNSLNHLTYLVSSSAKVRETLSNDGGIERLIEILHECHNSNFNTEDNIFNSERKLLTAWKWTLAFQCLVLIGTRGTEKIRQKVVKAGMLPIIATVLDNYLTLHERTFLHANVRPSGQSDTSLQESYIRPTATHLNPLPEQPNLNQPRPQVNNQQTTRASPQHNTNEGIRHQDQASRHTQPQISNRAQPTAFAPFDEARTEQNRAFMFNQHSQADTAPETASPSFTEVEVASQPIFNPSAAQIFSNTNNTDATNTLNDDDATRTSQAFTESAFNTLPNNTTSNFLNQIDSFSNAAMSQSMASESADMTSNVSGHTFRGPNFFQNNHSDSLTSDDYDSLSIQQLFKLIHVNGITPSCNNPVNGGCTNKSLANNDIKRRYLIVNIIKKLREEKEEDLLDDKFFKDCDYEMDNGLQFLSDLYLQEDRSIHIGNVVTSKSAPRNFTETGVVIPRDDDIVWSLQLLAYISKYPHLKEILQNTHLIIDMSIRDKQYKLYRERQMKSMVKRKQKVQARHTITPKSRKAKLFNERHSGDPSSFAIATRNSTNRGTHVGNATTGVRFLEGNASTGNYLERFNLSASNSPQMLNDINNIQNDNFILDEDKLDLGNKPDLNDLIEDAEAADDDEDDDDDGFGHHAFDKKDDRFATDDDDDEYLSSLAGANIKESTSSYLSQLYDSIIDAESIVNDLDREIDLFHISDSINHYVEIECKKLSNTIINKRLEQKQYLEEKWNYDTYADFGIDGDEDAMSESFNSDFDTSLCEYKKVNLFPIVEKFTFLAGTDMYYWSGVIMRNSCRRNDSKGGVRQCGNLECGRWEKFPREFSKCRRCKRTKYCSRECQMKAWHCHRNWCVPSGSSSNTSTTAASSTSTNYEAPGTSVGANGTNGLAVDGTVHNRLFATSNDGGDSRGDEGLGNDNQPSTSANNSD